MTKKKGIMTPTKKPESMLDSMSSPGKGNGSTCARAANHSTSQMDPKYVMKTDVDIRIEELR